MEVSWSEYKNQASLDLDSYGAYIYRGQRVATWGLTSTVHCTALVRSIQDVTGYVNYMLPRVHDAVEGWTGRSWDLSKPFGLAEFVAFLQHNGFPTPLLDWTASPYIAAYFAFEAVNHFAAGEGVADEAKAPLGMETLAIEGNDAGLNHELRKDRPARCTQRPAHPDLA